MGLAPYGEPRYAQRIFEHLIDVKADGTFRLDLDYFDYCTGLAMTNERFHRLFGGAAARSRIAAHPARHGSRRLGAGGNRGSAAAHDAVDCRRNRSVGSMSCRGRRAQLRGQRQDPARRPVRAAMDPAGRGRCRRRAGRGARRLPRTPRPSAPTCQGAFGSDGGGLSRAAICAIGMRSRVARRRRPLRGRRRRGAHCAGGARSRRWQGPRLVPGTNGVRTARPRRALDPGRRAFPIDAIAAEPQGQVPRVVPAVCAIGLARTRRRLVRARLRQPLYAPGRRRRRAPAQAR